MVVVYCLSGSETELRLKVKYEVARQRLGKKKSNMQENPRTGKTSAQFRKCRKRPVRLEVINGLCSELTGNIKELDFISYSHAMQNLKSYVHDTLACLKKNTAG